MGRHTANSDSADRLATCEHGSDLNRAADSPLTEGGSTAAHRLLTQQKGTRNMSDVSTIIKVTLYAAADFASHHEDLTFPATPGYVLRAPGVEGAVPASRDSVTVYAFKGNRRIPPAEGQKASDALVATQPVESLEQAMLIVARASAERSEGKVSSQSIDDFAAFLEEGPTPESTLRALASANDRDGVRALVAEQGWKPAQVMEILGFGS